MSEDESEDAERGFATQPETCPRCGLTLDDEGRCRTRGCAGPSSVRDAAEEGGDA